MESTGSDVFAHFTLESGQATSAELAELAADSGTFDTLAGGREVVARLDAASKIKEEDTATLWLDSSKIHLFDQRDGTSLLAIVADADVGA
jgi:multiple sugar transport system ATP-binding protein